MTAEKKLRHLSVEDYLAGELQSPVKHEYLGGLIYAMAVARRGHNRVATNATVSLGLRLRGKRCEAFNSDMKVRVVVRGQVRFYYPDVTVACAAAPDDQTYDDAPTAIFEVLSQSTRRIDAGEKLDAYLTIPSLCVYGMIESDAPLVVIHRRTSHGFEEEVYEGLDAVVPLLEIETELPLAEIYDRVQFIPEPPDQALNDDGSE